MSVRVDSSSLIAGAVVCGNRGLGVTGAVIRSTTSTGTHGAGLLYDDWDSAADDAKEFRLLIETQPVDGALFVYEDGSFYWTPATDGTRSFVGRLFVDGADLGTQTNFLVSGDGSVNGQIAVTEASDTAAATGFVPVAGILSTTEAQDVAQVVGEGSLGQILGTMSVTEAADVAASIGGVRVSGSVAASEQADSAYLNGIAGIGVKASASSRTSPQLSGSRRPSQLGATRRPRQLS